jgi:hypothetical protein
VDRDRSHRALFEYVGEAPLPSRTAAGMNKLERRRLEALTVANAVRRERAQLKRDIAAGMTSAADVLLDPPDVAARLPVGDLLISQRGWGPVKCKRFLAKHVNEGEPIGELTLRQRQLLALQLNQYLRRRARATPGAVGETVAVA